MKLFKKFSTPLDLLLSFAFIIFGYSCIWFLYPRLPTIISGIFFGYSDQFPTSFQMFMWFPFFIGIFILLSFYIDYLIDKKNANELCYPIDESIILSSIDFSKIIETIKFANQNESSFASRILYQVIMKYQASRSVEQTSSMLDSLVESSLTRLENKLADIRYIAWLIPSLGFMGTVYGISMAVTLLKKIQPDDPTLLPQMASYLAVAFDTTLLGIVQTAIIVYLSTKLQSKEERTIIHFKEYVLENIINRVV